MIAQQRGAVLIVSLIMLLAITLIAVTSLSNSTLETKMVINQQDKESTFQDAESGISQGMRNDKYYEVYQDAAIDDGCVTEAVTASTNADGIQLTNLSVQNCFSGLSAAVGEDLNKFVYYHYEFNSNADSAVRNSSTNLVQGVRRIGPKID